MTNKIILTATALFIITSCGKSPNVAGGVETGNGVVMGIVASSVGKPVAAEVMLVPEKFVPVDQTLSKTMIDTTSENGEYSISAPTGIYNVVARTLGTNNNEVAIIRKVEITESTVRQMVSLKPAKSDTIALGSVATSSGTVWYQGTPFNAPFNMGDSVAIIPVLPKDDVLPELYKKETGKTEERIVKSVELRQSAGFPNYTSFVFNPITKLFFAGTKFSGLFSYDSNVSNNSFVSKTDTGIVSSFKAGISSLAVDEKGTILIGVGSNAVLGVANQFTVHDMGSSAIRGVGFTKSAQPVIAYSDKIKYGTVTETITGITALGVRNDTAFVGTSDGTVHLFDGKDCGSLSFKGSISHCLPMKNGSVVVVVPTGIELRNQHGVVSKFTEFASSGTNFPVSIKESADGSVWIVTKSNHLFYIDQNLKLMQIGGFENKISNTTGGGKAKAVDCAFDSNSNCWILFEDGSQLRLRF